MALGSRGDPLDAQCVLVEAHDANGGLRGLPQASCPGVATGSS